MTDACNEECPVGLETRNIFLDTDVFRSNAHNLNTKIMKLLDRYVANGIFVLHSTDVTPARSQSPDPAPWRAP